MSFARGRRVRSSLVPLLVLVIAAILVRQAPVGGQHPGPRPPEQPEGGPGGRAAAFDGVEVQRIGEGPTGSWLFAPGDRAVSAADADDRALPVVLFLHGFSALDPERYRAWIDHIVRRGAFVVYPDYQSANPLGDDWRTFLPNVMRATTEALDRLRADSPGRADETRIGVVGHSLGGVLAAGYAATARSAGLPQADVLMALQPGGCRGCEPLLGDNGVPLPDLAGVPTETLALVVLSEEDDIVSGRAARGIWEGMTAVPFDRRDVVLLVGDDHGSPPLRADHLVPQSSGPGGVLDALDWYGVWKLFDLLSDCGFYRDGCEEALGGTPGQRFMGVWSDGTPVREAVVSDDPGDAG